MTWRPNVPEDQDSKIWRYMTLPKFLATLYHQGLYFTRADLLGDPFEGSYTPRSLEAFEGTLDSSESEELVGRWRSILQTLRENTHVCCWHVSDVESAALWKLYGETLAIQSTYARLIDFLPENRYLVGFVEYIDYQRDHPDITNSAASFFYKRQSFRHEVELRAVSQYNQYRKGKLVPS